VAARRRLAIRRVLVDLRLTLTMRGCVVYAAKG
jgi:hypothetical protein